MSDAKALERAAEALLGPDLDLEPAEPYAATVLRARAALGRSDDPAPIVARWTKAHPGSADGEMRYRWPLTHKRLNQQHFWAGWPKEWTPWRPAEAALALDPFEFEARLSVPAVTADCAELLCELAAEPGHPLAADAQALLEETEPVLRREFAGYIQAAHAWTDTFALWCLLRRPHLLARLQPFALAIATCYAATAAKPGAVRGTRFPFHEVPLVSASAHLATGLLALGADLPLAPRLVSFVASRRAPGGGWADGDGPEDLLTTLVAADLLLHVDPSFDPQATRAFFAKTQWPGGWWRAHGPEVPWITAAIVEWLRACERPFPERFRWPHLPRGNRDHKTDLPFYAWFTQIAALFAALPGLAAAETDVAFMDLAGFRAFNNANGQERGDAVLQFFADRLAGLEAASAIRDGGDEFLVVGAPGRSGLAADLDRLRRAWPAEFRAKFGDATKPVVARILVTKSPGGRLVATREELGRAIGALKTVPISEEEGILRSLPVE